MVIPKDDALTLIDVFWTACDTLARQANVMPHTGEIDRRVKYRYYYYLNKALGTFKAHSMLIREGFLPEARLLSRAIFELLVDLLYYHRFPVELSERFEGYFFTACDWEDLLLSAGGDKKQIPASEVARIDALKATFCAKYGDKRFPKHWSGVEKLRERARIVGLEHAYLTTYHLTSDLAHCGVYSESSYLEFAEPSLARTMERLNQQEAQCEVWETCREILCCLRTIDEGLGLGMCEVIHSLHERLNNYSRQYMEVDDGLVT